MRTIDLRIALEEIGCTLAVEHGQLTVAEPLGGISNQLRREIEQHRGALRTLASLFPCAGCGREPFTGACHPCPRRRKPADRRRERGSVAR